MRVLVHVHPQFSFVIRSLIEISSISKVPIHEIDLVLVMGPSFLDHILVDFAKFLELTNPFENLVKSCTIIRPPINLLHINSLTHTESWEGFKELLGMEKLRKNLRNSCKDSLYRGLLPNFDHTTFHTRKDPQYCANALRRRLGYLRNLLNFYIGLQKKYLPDWTCCSHGYYDFHVAFLAASSQNQNSRVYVIADGQRNSYEIKDINQLDFGSEMAYISAAKNYHKLDKYDLPIPFSKNLTRDDKSPLNKALAPFIKYQHDSQIIGQNSIPIIFLPVFKEVTFHHYTSNLLFDSRYKWLEFTLNNLTSSQLPILVRPHPHSAEYNEKNDILSNIFSSALLSNRKLQIVESTDTMKSIIQDHTHIDHNFTIINFGNSVATELAELGINTLVSSDCLATSIDSAATLPYTRDIYSHYLKGLKPFNPHVNQTAAKISNKLQRLYTASTKKGAADSSYRLYYDSIYFFGAPQSAQSALITLKQTVSDHIKNIKFLNMDFGNFIATLPQK